MIRTTLAPGAPWPYAIERKDPSARTKVRAMRNDAMARLLKQGEWSAHTICGAVGMSKTATYRRLVLLAIAGTVTSCQRQDLSIGNKPATYYTWSNK